MPTTPVNTISGKKLEYQFDIKPLTTPVRYKASIDIALGTLLGKVTATGRMAAYDGGASDGTEVCVGIAIYPIITNSDGDITNLGDFGTILNHCDMYHNGCYKVSDLVGLDAGAVADLMARYLGGDSSSAGFLIIP